MRSRSVAACSFAYLRLASSTGGDRSLPAARHRGSRHDRVTSVRITGLSDFAFHDPRSHFVRRRSGRDRFGLLMADDVSVAPTRAVGMVGACRERFRWFSEFPRLSRTRLLRYLAWRGDPGADTDVL